MKDTKKIGKFVKNIKIFGEKNFLKNKKIGGINHPNRYPSEKHARTCLADRWEEETGESSVDGSPVRGGAGKVGLQRIGILLSGEKGGKGYPCPPPFLLDPPPEKGREGMEVDPPSSS